MNSGLAWLVEDGICDVEKQTGWNLHPHDDLKVTPRETFLSQFWSNKMYQEIAPQIPNKTQAIYIFSSREIVLLDAQDPNLESTRAIVHELAHYGQHKTFPDFIKRYEYLYKTLGVKYGSIPNALQQFETDLEVPEFVYSNALLDGHADIIALKSVLTPNEYEECINAITKHKFQNKVLIRGKFFPMPYYKEIQVISQKIKPEESLNQLYLNKEKRGTLFAP